MSQRSTDKSFFLPPITDLQSAQKTARQGTIACILIIVFNLVTVMVDSSMNGTSPSQLFIATMVVYAVLAILIYRMSLWAATAGLILYLGDRIMVLSTQGLSLNLIVTILFVLAFINSLRGISIYHQFRQQRKELLQEAEADYLSK